MSLDPARPQTRPAPERSWTALIGAGLRARVSPMIRRFADAERGRIEAVHEQRRQLARLIELAARTEFGREHGFARLTRLPLPELVDAYRDSVPVRDWYAFARPIERMRIGAEPDVLWPGLVNSFAQTSGTTAGDKFIPVSRQMMRSNFIAALCIFACLHRFGISLPRLLSGRLLFLGGSTTLHVSDKGIRTGDLSGLVTPMIRWPISEVYTPGPAIALESHWPTKIEQMAHACAPQDVRMISGMPSWTAVLFERVLEITGKARILDVWPNLTAFVHGGVKYAPFDARLRELLSGSPDGPGFPSRVELYPASEGFVALQDRADDPGLRLLTNIGLFFEFVPIEEIDSPNPAAFTCDRVETGQRYVVVMTTCAGLWRYVLGDVVEFDTICARADGTGGTGPPRLRIVGRHRHFINAFGENLIVEHVENAVAEAARATGAVVGEFTAAPVYPDADRRAGLELAVEFERPPASLPEFADAVDRSLKAQNVDYTTKRTDSLGMAPPTVTPLPIGAFHRWLEREGKLGGQHKCPRCANHREIIQGVLGVLVGSP